MKIATTGFFKSCLYRLALLGVGGDHGDVPTNLCPFVRRAALGFLFSVLIVAVSVFVVIIALDPIISLALFAYTGHFIPFVSDLSVLGGFVGYGFALFHLTVYGLKTLCTYIGSRFAVWEYRTVVEVNSEIEPASGFWTVLTAYWKAVHDKICPRIEFK